ncbi:hypothetical protein O6H91_23G069300 [Diphasiastrum complanatum]|uniref:Uncharacterized protein n=1 Tax=Diphasiastrum complanatum TaxID=34168 RepID=A0ACC2ABW4_DIPCM|nr:hypothetical protein O6H91_23G069300 [Diphasiastrum complanatum]
MDVQPLPCPQRLPYQKCMMLHLLHLSIRFYSIAITSPSVRNVTDLVVALMAALLCTSIDHRICATTGSTHRSTHSLLLTVRISWRGINTAGVKSATTICLPDFQTAYQKKSATDVFNNYQLQSDHRKSHPSN